VIVAVQPVSRVVVQLGAPSWVTQSLSQVHRSVTSPLMVPVSRSATTVPDTVPGSSRKSEFQPVTLSILSGTMLSVIRFHSIWASCWSTTALSPARSKTRVVSSVDDSAASAAVANTSARRIGALPARQNNLPRRTAASQFQCPTLSRYSRPEEVSRAMWPH